MGDQTIIDILDRQAIDPEISRETMKGVWARRLGALSIPVVVIATLLHRINLIDTPTLLGSLGLASLLAMSAIVLAAAALVTVLRHGWRGLGDAAVGVIFALAVLAIPLWAAVVYFEKPSITDITTDPLNPPDMPAARAQRPPLSNSVTYNRDFTAVQRLAYPQIVPLRAAQPPEGVYSIVLALIEDRQWQVLDARAPGDGLPGRVEAVARSMLFGFSDDVVVRISYDGDNAQVDMRSRARYGQHDLGANARRIDKFLSELATRLAVPLE